MILAAMNKPRQLLFLNFSERVRADDYKSNRENAEALLAELQPGFRILVNLSSMESMDLDCVPEIARFMNLSNRSGVSMVVRVIADPSKDIGLNILSLFHYGQHVRTATCATMTEAATMLGL
jgi:hypothetical protein